ncbi:MAG: TraR/DksA family transcriptional regulator [Litorimonas sp.]
MTDTKHYKKVLTDRRAYLTGKSEEIEERFEHSGDEPFDGDSGEVRNLDVLDDLDDMAQSEIRAIDAALDRIKEGSFGNCVTCGDPIDEDRLKTLPHTPFCKDHAL